MEKFKHVKRSSILFHLYGLLTLGITSAVTLTRMQKEYAILKGEEAAKEKKLLPYPAVYFLGFITLGIVPFVWRVKFASRVGALAKERKVNAPKLTGARFACWATFGLLILIGPWYAFRLLFLNFNALLFNENERINALAVAQKDLSLGQPNLLLADKEEAKSEMEAETSETPLVEEAPKSELDALLERYSSCEEGRFAVRFSKADRPLRSFAKKEDAISFAKELASLRHVGVRYVKLK